MINYKITRLQPKKAVVASETHDAGNICEIVVGVTATSGDYSSYIDGTIPCTNLTISQYKAQIDDLVKDFVSENDFKNILEKSISDKTKKPESISISISDITI